MGGRVAMQTPPPSVASAEETASVKIERRLSTSIPIPKTTTIESPKTKALFAKLVGEKRAQSIVERVAFAYSALAILSLFEVLFFVLFALSTVSLTLAEIKLPIAPTPLLLLSLIVLLLSYVNRIHMLNQKLLHLQQHSEFQSTQIKQLRQEMEEVLKLTKDSLNNRIVSVNENHF